MPSKLQQYKMNEQRVSRRLQSSSSPMPLDVAWAQVHKPSVLTRNHILPLDRQQMQIVTQAYAAQGGLNVPTLESREHLYDAQEDGTFVMLETLDNIDSIHRTRSAIVIDNEEETHSAGNTTTSHNIQYTKTTGACPSHLVKDDSGSSTPLSGGPRAVVFTPVLRLKRKYGILELEENAETPQQESGDIPNNAIPVGTYRHDRHLARLVTATIDQETRALQYTIQPIDKNFVQVVSQDTYTVVTGHTWTSAGDIDKDAENITFIASLRTKTYSDLLIHVFNQLSNNSDFYTVWVSGTDMLQHPRLHSLAKDIQEIFSEPNLFGVEDMTFATIRAYDQYLEMMLFGLRFAVKNHFDVWRKAEEDPTNPDQLKHIIRSVDTVWQAFGCAFKIMLDFRKLCASKSVA